MINILNKSIKFVGAHAALAQMVGWPETLTVADLIARGPWAYADDLSFTGRPAQIRAGIRLIDACNNLKTPETLVGETPREYIELDHTTHDLLKKAVQTPQRHKGESPMPAQLSRAILPLIEEIENAK